MRHMGAVGVFVLLLFSGGFAEAQDGGVVAGAGADVVALEAQSQAQDAQLAQQVQDIYTVGSGLQETQAQVDSAVARSQELSQQTGKLEGRLESEEQGFTQSKALYEEQVRAAYKGDNVEGLVGVLDSVLSPGKNSKSLSRAQVRNVLGKSQQRVEDYRRSRQKLEDTVRQVSQKRSDYGKALREERAQIERLRRKEAEIEASISRIRIDQKQTDARIQQLRKSERERILRTRPATGGLATRAPSAQRKRELRIARNEIVARPVKSISKKRYRKLYRKSAKKYGFGRDWYILAAVGKVETNHGENMGPSSAGAMGPMQFMPSTWASSGVDGNGDGVANVMDPRDAIPAAAKYLETGGAPEDWYAALYSYNHADWYVKKVLGVAEGYRRLSEDDRVGPYV